MRSLLPPATSTVLSVGEKSKQKVQQQGWSVASRARGRGIVNREYLCARIALGADGEKFAVAGKRHGLDHMPNAFAGRKH